MLPDNFLAFGTDEGFLQARVKTVTWWATPFEVHLAAKKFNVIIHLFHSEPGAIKEVHYCFEPQAPRSAKKPASIFLKSELMKNGNFSFQWYQPNPKIFRADTLFEALHLWLSQEHVRPISVDLLGKSELDFVSKCSKALLKKHKLQMKSGGVPSNFNDYDYVNDCASHSISLSPYYDFAGIAVHRTSIFGGHQSLQAQPPVAYIPIIRHSRIRAGSAFQRRNRSRTKRRSSGIE